MAKDIIWAGGEHAFELRIDHLRAIQDKCDAGPAFVLQRLSSGQWYVDDVVQPIRLGLVGGGMAMEDARKLVRRHVEDRPLSQSVLTAQAILMLALYGDEDDPVGEAPAGGETDQTLSRAADGGSVGSTSGPASSAAT